MTALRSIAEVCEAVVVGHVGPSSQQRDENGIPFLMGKNIGAGHLKLDDLEHVTPAFHRAQRKSQLAPGDVLVVRIGHSGQAAEVPETLGEANCAGLVVIRRPKDVLPRYLVHFLNSPVGRRQSLAETKGSTRQTLNTKSVANTRIPVPSLHDQRRIVDILDRAEALCEMRKAAIVGLKSLVQSIFIDLGGDTLSTQPFRALVSEFRYGTSVKAGSDGYPTLRIPNVIDGSLDLTDLKVVAVPKAEFHRLQLTDGDLLFVRTNGNPQFVGRCAMFDSQIAEASGFSAQSFIYASYLIRARIDGDARMSVFIREFMRSSRGRALLRSKCKTSAGQFNLNTEGLGAIEVPIAPRGLRDQFAIRVDAVDRNIARESASLRDLQELFRSLQSRAFDGSLSPEPA